MNDTSPCSVCGRAHSKSESELSFKRPDVINGLSERDRELRCKFTDETWILDDERLFLRGLLPLPVHGRSRRYCIGVWAEVSREAFARIRVLWSDPAQSEEPRMPGILANDLPLVPSSLGLPVAIQLTGPKTRPEYFLASTEHPFYSEQVMGIDAHRALEYTESM
jgi:hypothetical protein